MVLNLQVKCTFWYHFRIRGTKSISSVVAKNAKKKNKKKQCAKSPGDIHIETTTQNEKNYLTCYASHIRIKWRLQFGCASNSRWCNSTIHKVWKTWINFSFAEMNWNWTICVSSSVDWNMTITNTAEMRKM